MGAPRTARAASALGQRPGRSRARRRGCRSPRGGRARACAATAAPRGSRAAAAPARRRRGRRASVARSACRAARDPARAARPRRRLAARRTARRARRPGAARRMRARSRTDGRATGVIATSVGASAASARSTPEQIQSDCPLEPIVLRPAPARSSADLQHAACGVPAGRPRPHPNPSAKGGSAARRRPVASPARPACSAARVARAAAFQTRRAPGPRARRLLPMPASPSSSSAAGPPRRSCREASSTRSSSAPRPMSVGAVCFSVRPMPSAGSAILRLSLGALPLSAHANSVSLRVGLLHLPAHRQVRNLGRERRGAVREPARGNSRHVLPRRRAGLRDARRAEAPARRTAL